MPRSELIIWPPSTPMSAAILPCLRASRISAVVVARTISFGCLRTCSRTASIWTSARSTASGPVTLLGIQMEKKIALRLPSRMRGRSMLPVEPRVPRSNFPSRKRCVVSSCVSTTMDEKCSLRAFSEMPSDFIAPARSAPAAAHALAHRIARTIPRLLVLLLSSLHFLADFFRLFHHAEYVAAENLADIVFLVALSQKRFRDFGQLGAIFQAFRHVRAIEIRAHADVLRAHKFNDVVNMFDNLFPAYVRELSGLRQIPRELDLRSADAHIVVAAFFLEFLLHAADVPRDNRKGAPVFLAEIISLIVDLNDSALGSQRLDHVVGHIARVIRNGARGRMGCDERHLADFQRIVKRLVGNVRNVHEHSLAVHFADYFFAEIRQSVMRRLVRGGVRPLVIVEMRERHVAHAQARVIADHVNVVADHVAAFHAHEDGNLALRAGAADLLRGGGQHQVLALLPDVLQDDINLVESLLYRRRTESSSRNEDGEKLRVQAAFPHPRYVNVAFRIAFPEIELAGQHTLRCVRMRIENNG